MRVLAIGDIHGCSGPLDDVLAKAAPAADDLIVTLGDYVDRGPDSRGVIDRLIRLGQSHRLICLRGNHEIMMLAAKAGDRGGRNMWLSVGGAQTLGSYGPAPGWAGTMADVPVEHWSFLERLLPYYETETHLFVHAGLYPDLELAEQPDSVLFWDFMPESCRHHSGKRIVCGHTSQKNGVPKVVPGAVCIDTYPHGGGWLTCLDTSRGHYWQADMMGRTREGWLEEEDAGRET